MSRVLLLLFAAIAALAADDWNKVRDLKSGTELRIVKKGAKQPVLAKFDEANEKNLTIVVKNEQVAIPKEQIDRIDYRPPQTGSRMTKETKTTTTEPSVKSSTPSSPGGYSRPSTSVSSGVSFGSKPDFETIYRRAPAAPAK